MSERREKLNKRETFRLSLWFPCTDSLAVLTHACLRVGCCCKMSLYLIWRPGWAQPGLVKLVMGKQQDRMF